MKKPCSAELAVRAAVEADAGPIHELLAFYAAQKVLLPRTVEDILEKIRNFAVAEIDGVFAGCCAMRNYGGALYEIRSLAVKPERQHRGAASALVNYFLDGLVRSGEPGRVFTLTCQDAFFLRLGFRIVEKSLFPQKIWSDCRLCPKKNCCDEIALLRDVNMQDFSPCPKRMKTP